jgi:hypothetical protein
MIGSNDSNTIMNLQRGRKFPDELSDYQLLKKDGYMELAF